MGQLTLVIGIGYEQDTKIPA